LKVALNTISLTPIFKNDIKRINFSTYTKLNIFFYLRDKLCSVHHVYYIYMLHVNSFTMQLTKRKQTICFLFQVLNTEISLEDASGKTKLAVDVFSKSLWFLKRHFFFICVTNYASFISGMGKMMMGNILASHNHQFFYLVCSFPHKLFCIFIPDCRDC
jgi:hypothetical protein